MIDPIEAVPAVDPGPIEAAEVVDPAEDTVDPETVDPEAVDFDPVSKIKLPPRMPKRGRPKGSETTVIGLPKKKSRITKVLPFIKLCGAEKERKIMSWIMKPQSLNDSIFNGERLAEKQDLFPWTKMPPKISDEDLVDITRVKKYFSKSGWEALSSSIDAIKERNLWLCKACEQELSGQYVINCDHCLEWYDRRCVGLKKEPKSKLWMCPSCK